MPHPLVDRSCVEIIRRGGLVIFPTETLYGLGCIVTDEAAVRRLFEVKGRDPGKPPPVLVADEAQLQMLVDSPSGTALQLIEVHWPGALTLVLRARADVLPLLTGLADDGSRTIAVRRSAHPVAQALCEGAGVPLIATSANHAGATGSAALPHSLDDIPDSLRQHVDIVIDGGVVAGQPSTIIDCVADPPRILRQGAIHLKQFANDS